MLSFSSYFFPKIYKIKKFPIYSVVLVRARLQALVEWVQYYIKAFLVSDKQVHTIA